MTFRTVLAVIDGTAAPGLSLTDRSGGTSAILIEEAARRGAHHVVRHAARPVLFAH